MAVAIALARQGAAHTQRANVIGATIALSFCGLPPLWWAGAFTFEVVAMSLAAVPFYWFGTWAGSLAFASYGSRYFRNAALLALALVGMVTMGLAINDYVSG